MGNLVKAHKNAQKGKGFYKEVKMVNQNQGNYLCELSEMERNGTYKPQSMSIFKRTMGARFVIFRNCPIILIGFISGL